MRILTPIEQREVERVRKHIRNDTSFVLRTYQGDEITYDIDSDDNMNARELWLNILDLALQANDALKTDWCSSPKGSIIDALSKLRPNG